MLAKKHNYVLRTPLNYVPEKGEVNEQPSMTVPDMTMSIGEILTRFAQGRPLSFSTTMHYTGDDYMPDVRSMDITEVEELRERTAARIEELTKQRDEQLRDLDTKRKEKRKKLDKILEERVVKQLDIEDAIAAEKSNIIGNSNTTKQVKRSGTGEGSKNIS